MSTTFEPVNNIAPWGCNVAGSLLLSRVCESGDISGVGWGPDISEAQALEFAVRLRAYLARERLIPLSKNDADYLEQTAKFFETCGGFSQL